MSTPKRFKRIKALTVNRAVKSLNLLLDESQSQIDAFTIRTIISCVEIDAKITLADFEEQIRTLVEKTISVSSKKKVHLTDFTQEEKNAVINAVSQLEFNAKVWIHYDSGINPTVAKVNAIRNTVVSLQKKHSKRSVRFLVEHATDYNQVVKDKSMTTSAYLSLLPDICCYLMKLKLDKKAIIASIPNDEGRKRKSQDIEQIISFTHEHIRLQVFNTNKNYSELTRSNRL